MSVINKMLKDLDSRQQPHNVQNISALQQSAQAAKSSKLPWLIVLLLVFVAFGFYLYQSLASQPKPESNPIIEKTAVIQPQPQVESVQPKAVKTERVVAEKQQPILLQAQVPVTPVVDNNEAQTAVVKTESVVQPKIEVKATPPAPRPQSQLEIKEVKLSPKELANKFIKEAKEAELSGNLATAREDYAKAIKLDQTRHQVRAKLAALYYGERNNAAAIQLLNDGIQRFPQQTEFRLLLAKIQLKQNKPQQAQATLASIADSDSMAPEKWIQQGSIAQQQQQYSQAVIAFKKLTEYEPSTARWWLGLGYNLDAAGQYVPAVEAYRKALQLPSLSSASRKYIVSRLAQITTNK